jgi:hypothetical protein
VLARHLAGLHRRAPVRTERWSWRGGSGAM